MLGSTLSMATALICKLLTRCGVAFGDVLLRAAAVSASACLLRHFPGVLAVRTAVFFSFSDGAAARRVSAFIPAMHRSISLGGCSRPVFNGSRYYVAQRRQR